MEATGETVRSRASTRRTPGVLRRGQTVSGDEETLARGSTTTRAYSQWRGPRGAPRPRRFPVGKTPVGFGANQNAGKRPNTAAQIEILSCEILRISGRAARHFLFSRRGVSLILGEAVRGAPRGDPSARRGEEDLARREPWVSWYVPRPRDRPTRVSPRPNPRGRAARPAGKHAPGDPLAVMFAGADAIARDALPADPSPVPSPRRPRRAPSPVVFGARSP